MSLWPPPSVAITELNRVKESANKTDIMLKSNDLFEFPPINIIQERIRNGFASHATPGPNRFIQPNRNANKPNEPTESGCSSKKYAF